MLSQCRGVTSAVQDPHNHELALVVHGGDGVGATKTDAQARRQMLAGGPALLHRRR
jgi:hypothetical protein